MFKKKASRKYVDEGFRQQGDTIVHLMKKIDAILDHLNLEYYEEEKKESGLREKENYLGLIGTIDGYSIYSTPDPQQPKKRGRKKGSKNKKK